MRGLILLIGAYVAVCHWAVQAAQGAASACAAFDQVEAEGRSQMERRIAEIDSAAAAGDVARFCGASRDLVFVYRSLETAGAACSAERAAKWAQAASESRTALAKTCP